MAEVLPSAAEFCAATFPDSSVGPRHKAPSDFSGGRQGEELTLEFTVLGRACVGLNGGPNFQPNEAVSFMVLTEDQEETDRYWNAITRNGGKESACGWRKDRWGFSWQITPWALLEAAPRLDPGRRRLESIPGQPPGPRDLTAGCRFAPRCKRATSRCAGAPPLAGDEVQAFACWHPLERAA